MDVHVRNSMLLGRDRDGQRLASGRCANTLLELATRLTPVEQHAHATAQPVRVVLESTTNSRPIKRLLEQYGTDAGIDLTVDVLDARKLRVIAESVSKCDRLDTAILCDLAASGLHLPTCYIPDDDVFALREHLRARHDLVRLRTMVKNRVHAVLHRRGILAPSGGLFTRAGRTFLNELDLDDAGREILTRYLDQLDRLDAAVADATAAVRTLARSQRWTDAAACLMTMPGVGLITSMTILAELGPIDRFKSRAAVSNYAGLVPVIRQSNTKCYRGGITKRGPMHLRAVLVEAAWVAIRRVPRYDAIYRRVRDRRGAQVGIVAVARRMLEDAFVMLKTGQPFRYTASSVAG